MANVITKTSYDTETDIMLAQESYYYAIPCVVSDAGVEANAEGKKIIKAGTPLYGSESVFMNRQTVLTTQSVGNTPYGVARHNIDVTAGNANDTLVAIGVVDYLKLDDDVKALVDAARNNLSHILFVKGRAK